MNTSKNNQQTSFIKIYQNETMIIHSKMLIIQMINRNQIFKDFHNKNRKNITMNLNSLSIKIGKEIQDKDRNRLFKNSKVNNQMEMILIDHKNLINSEMMIKKDMKKVKILMKRTIMIQKKKVEMIKKIKQIFMKIVSMIEILILFKVLIMLKQIFLTSL